MNEALLNRHAIIDQHQELVGYKLSLQREKPVEVPANRKTPHGPHSATLVCAAYAELGFHSALGQSRAFLATDNDFLHGDAIEGLPPDGVVLELELDTPPDEATLGRCRALRERRYSLALSDYDGLNDRSLPLLSLVDVIKIDIRGHDDTRLSELAAPLTRLPLKLLAEGVDTRDAMERCRKIGFQLFQGNYFANAEIISGRRLSASQAGLIQLINLARRDADSARIEEGIKREPALAVNLLRIVNSVGYGLTRRISSLRQAITVLGRRQLQRWLQLMLMAPDGKTPDTSRSPLLQVAALRGRMMEILIEQSHLRDNVLSDQAFITGIMSMMPAALGLPMKEIFAQISLEPQIVRALIAQEGILGKTLALLECYDGGDAAGCDTLLAQMPDSGLNRSQLNTSLTEALRWVNENDQ